VRLKTYIRIFIGLSLLLFLSSGVALTMFFTSYKSLVVENERIRSFNVRRERRLKWMQAPQKIDIKNISLPYHVLGIKPSVIAALLKCENGPEYLESGSIDKSDFFALYFPLERWSALEGSRTLNRMLWEWVTLDKNREHAFYLYAAKPYTALSVAEQNSWANNMLKAEQDFRKQIVMDTSKEEPIVVAMRTITPTPSISKTKKRKK
jgi:hypothetical protein